MYNLKIVMNFEIVSDMDGNPDDMFPHGTAQMFTGLASNAIQKYICILLAFQSSHISKSAVCHNFLLYKIIIMRISGMTTYQTTSNAYGVHSP